MGVGRSIIYISKLKLRNLYACSYVQISDYNMLPDIAKLAGQLKTCLQESDDVPRDITMLFDNSLFKLDTSLVPNAIKYLVVVPEEKQKY